MTTAKPEGAAELGILPTPREAVLPGGTADVRRLALPGESPFDRQVMAELWAECGGLPGGGVGGGGALVFLPEKGLGPEGYTLSISPRGARVGHSSPAGAYYGFVTLCELMRVHGERVPCAEIQDGPRLPLRGATDDISRGQISTLENFKSIVRRMSFLKLNLYMPYMEDVFRFESEPEIGKYSDPVPAAEWRELCAYARRHFVQVRPIFNTLGHWDRIAPLEKYRPLVIAPPGVNTVRVLDPENPAVRPLLARLLGEVVDAFGPGLVHVGGDEPRHLTLVHGAEKSGRLFTDHYGWMHGELGKLGCETMLYADVFAPGDGNYGVGLEAARRLPRDVKLMYWNYNPHADYAGLGRLIDMGFQTCVSPHTMSSRRFVPDLSASYLNALNLDRAAGGREAGMVTSSWADGPDCPREFNWQGRAAAAEAGWSAAPMPGERLMTVFHRQFFGFGSDFDAARLEPLYRYERHAGVPDYGGYSCPLWKVFWTDARRPVDGALKARAGELLAAMEAARECVAGLRPRFNAEAWACMEFGARRLAFLARKLAALEPGPYASREKARAAVPAIRELAAECRELLEEARARWFASNRKSQWTFVESRYLDLAESLDSLARYSENKPDCPKAEKFLLDD